MEPITDQHQLLAAMLAMPVASLGQVLDNLRGTILEGVLPTPHRDLSVSEVVNFKEKHRELLRTFRRQVESKALTCAQEPDLELRVRLAREANAELKVQRDEIDRKMKEVRWPTSDGALCAILMGAPAAAGGLATGKPALTATGLVPLVVEAVRRQFGDRGLTDQPAIYAALAMRDFQYV